MMKPVSMNLSIKTIGLVDNQYRTAVLHLYTSIYNATTTPFTLLKSIDNNLAVMSII